MQSVFYSTIVEAILSMGNFIKKAGKVENIWCMRIICIVFDLIVIKYDIELFGGFVYGIKSGELFTGCIEYVIKYIELFNDVIQ